MRLLLFLSLLPVEYYMHELIEIDGIDIRLPRQGLLRVSSVFDIAGAESTLRVKALNGEAGLSPDVEVIPELDSEWMRF